jgi:hypothetical protein
MDKIRINQGSQGAFFVRNNGKLIASFIDETDAELFVKTKWPELENTENV